MTFLPSRSDKRFSSRFVDRRQSFVDRFSCATRVAATFLCEEGSARERGAHESDETDETIVNDVHAMYTRTRGDTERRRGGGVARNAAEEKRERENRTAALNIFARWHFRFVSPCTFSRTARTPIVSQLEVPCSVRRLFRSLVPRTCPESRNVRFDLLSCSIRHSVARSLARHEPRLCRDFSLLFFSSVHSRSRTTRRNFKSIERCAASECNVRR